MYALSLLYSKLLLAKLSLFVFGAFLLNFIGNSLAALFVISVCPL